MIADPRCLTASSFVPMLILGCVVALAACGKKKEDADTSAPEPDATSSQEGELFRVGSVAVYESDLKRRISEHYRGNENEISRKKATQDLIERARFVQAALDAKIDKDPAVREEFGRILEGRLRETVLIPQLEKALEVSDERLRELYQSALGRYRAKDQRQVAALWLNPGLDREKAKRYAAKMTKAREFLLNSADLKAHPERGFSVLGADYSEHSASRFRGGVIGWMEAKGGPDQWSKAVAEIAFELQGKGDVSEVVTRPEGVFLVRVMDLKSGVTKSFESVAEQLRLQEQNRLRQQRKAEFAQEIEDRYPVNWPE